jgi:hypothetical protein
MISKEAFPRLTHENHRAISPASNDYNCIAWSVGDVDHWWQPGVHWPIPAHPDDYAVRVLTQLFASLGYEDCGLDANLEPGFEKVALFGQSLFYTHAARQLPTGKWTSKLGKAEDIEHDSPHDVAGGVYGVVVQIMKRRVLPHTDALKNE